MPGLTALPSCAASFLKSLYRLLSRKHLSLTACLLLLCASGARAQTAIASFSTGSAPQAVAMNPVTNTLYVANYNSANVTVINGLTGATSTVAVGSEPKAIAVNPVTNQIYVANYSNGESGTVTVIDGATNTTATVTVGHAPVAIAVNPVTNTIYVANLFPDDLDNSTVSVINGATNATTSVKVGLEPNAVAVNPVTNTIYVINNYDDTVSVINGATNKVTATESTGVNPRAIAVNAVTNKVYVVNGVGTLTVIDGATNGTTTVQAGQNLYGIAVNPATNKIYVIDYEFNDVAIIDGATNAKTTLAVGNNPDAVVVNPLTNQVYIANQTSGTVTVVKGATATSAATVTATVTVGTDPDAVAVNPVTNQIYAVNNGSNNVTEIDGAVNTVAATVATGTNPNAMAVNPATGTIYVANAGSGTVTAIDAATGAASSTVGVGATPDAIAVNPVTNEIYVANFDDGTVTEIDGASGSTATLGVGNTPDSVAVNPVTNQIYVANRNDGTVTVIDGTTNATTTVTVGTSPVAIATNPSTNHVYVVNNSNAGTVTVIDGVTNATSTLSVGSYPDVVTVNPSTNRIYVGNANSGNVSVIDGATSTSAATVTGTVTVGTSPSAIAVNAATNQIYVANNFSLTLSVINGANNTVTATVNVGTNPQSVAVNPVTNRIYVGNNYSGNVSVIDSVNNSVVATIPTGEILDALVVNPVTDTIYAANYDSNNVSVIAADVYQALPITATPAIQSDDPLTVSSTAPFVTRNGTPTFTVTITSAYSSSSVYSSNPSATNPPPSAVYYWVDDGSAVSGNPTQWGVATASSPTNPGTFNIALSGQSVGVHTLYYYAAYGNEGTPSSTTLGNGNSPEISNLQQFVYEILPGTSSTALAADVDLQNAASLVTFTATVTVGSGHSANPTGTVYFYDGSTMLGSGTLSGSEGTYTAKFATNALPVGNDTITAVYSGDINYASSTSSSLVEQIVGPPASITVVSGNGQTAEVGTAFLNPLIVLVKDSNGVPVPNAAVVFSGAGLSYGSSSVTTGSNGEASTTATPTSTGSLTVTASVTGYSPTATFSETGTSAAAPQVTGISPANGPYEGGTTVTITASWGDGVVSAVHFGATPATSFAVISATQITAVSPAGSLGSTVDVTVTTANGTSATSASDRFTFVAPSYMVSVTSDDVLGVPGNCIVAATSNTSPNNNCSLRDALAAAAQAGIGNIVFAPQVFPASNSVAQNTITLTSGNTLNIPSKTTIQGLTSGSGSGLTNLVTVSGGNGAYGDFSIFTLASGVTNAAIANLNIVNGNAGSGLGGGINSNGLPLTVSECTFAGNSAGQGGAILNGSTLTVNGSTFVNNSAINGGGAVVNEGTATITNSTFASNSASGSGGGIDNDGTMLTLSDSTFSGNSALQGAGVMNSSGSATVNNNIFSGNTATGGANKGGGLDDIANGVTANHNVYWNNLAGGSEDDCDSCAANTNAINGNPNLASIGHYGGPTQTMVPLPGSAAICAAPASLVPSGTTTDQRGVTIGAGGYCASGDVDAGAVQTDYALTFTTPAASPQTSGEAFPVAVTLSENGSGISGVSIPITLSSGATLSGSPVTETTGSNGVANYSLTVTNASQVNGLTLTAALPAPPTPTATSIFNLDPAISTVTGISPSTGSTAGGSSVTISGTNFNGATAVMFGVAPASSFTVNSKTSITAVSPAGTGVVDVTVTTPLGTTATSSADQFIYYVATSLIPAVTPGSTFIYNQQPTITAMVNPAGASGTLTATLDSSTSLTVTGGGGNFGITLPGTPLTLGSHTIALSFTGATGYGNSTGRITLTVNAFPLVVNTNADDQSPSTTGCLSSPEGTCTLRDALLTAGNLGAGNITFSSSMSITLTSGNTLSIPSNTTIQGLTSGGGATLTNLVTVNGGTSVQIFNVASGVTNAVIANLILTDGGIIGGNGGGIASQGTLTVTGSTFYNNAAEYSAGAIWNNGGTLTVSDSTFSQNGGGSSGSGGAIWNNGGTLTVTNSTFSDNSIYGYGPGGAIANNGTATVSNSTFSGNYTLGGVGGALYMGSGTLTVTNSVFTGNSAATDSGGGIEVDAGTLAVSNSVFSSNTGGDCIGSGCPTNGTNGNLLGVASAGLAALGNYGGPTQTMIPLPSSPAICAGTATPQGGLTLPATDQRGVAFGAGGYCPSGSVDAGAVQTDYSLTFTTEPPPTVTVGANFSAAVALDESGTAFGTAAVTIPLTLTGNATLSGGSASTSGGVTNYTSLQVSTAGSGDTLTADLTLNGLTISAVSSSFTANDAGTTTTASDASATYSSSAQSVALSATVTSNLGAVNAGTVTFTVLKGSTPVGTATSGTVNAGTAGVSYTLPAGAIVGTYTIKAVYNAAGDFNASSDTSHTLTVNTAVTTTTASSASATYSASAQSVTLSATVTSSRGTVSAGTVTFTVLSGSTPVGTATSGTVTGGEVSASFRLPAGAAVGTDTIQAAYIGAGDFTASSDTSHLLTVNAAATTTTAANASVTYSTSAQSVKLSAAVASGAGTVNEGTVTFTVLNGSTPVGTATSGTVNTGSASANYSLPAGATGGTYTIRAVYNAAGSFITSSDTSHTLTVNQVIPSITWAAPAAITYGTALSASQLDATSPVAGTIAYTPALGAVLNAGSQTLSATLTPTDSTDFKTATASVTLTVNQAAQTITFTPPTSPVYYGISPITLGATGGASGAPVTFSIVSGPGSLSGTNNSILTVTGTGAIVIAAHQAGSVNFAAAPQVTRSITVLTPVPSTLTAPASGSLLTGASEVFTWSPGTGVTEYDLHLSAIAPGDSELYSSGDVTRTSAAVNGLPTNGETIYARLYSVINGATVYNDYTYSTGSLAQLTSPSPSSLLTATTVEFTWSAGTGVSQYDLHLSTVAPGDYDLYVSGHITGTSRVVTKLPTNGTTVYARLYSVIGGVTFYSDYTYSTGSLAQLTTPAPSSLLPNSTVEFAWSAGTGVSQYDLHLSTVAPGDYDLYVSGHITGTSRVVTKLPTNGTTIYARLYSVIGGVTFYNDYTYATGALAQLTSPAPSSLLPNSTVEFTWSAGTGVSQYDLHLSTVAPGDYDLYVSGHITGTSRVVTKLPTNGTTIYARLYSVIDGITFYNDYTYATGSAAVLTSPAPGSLLANSTEVFTWSAGTGVSQYDLHLSAVAPGDYDLYVSGHITGTATTVHGLPTNEAKIYARLYSVIDGITFYNDYTYKTE